MVRIIKENIKLLIGIIIGAIIFGGGVYASSIAAKDASYENKSSGLSSTNIQDAVDELYTKATELKNTNTDLQSQITSMKGYYYKHLCFKESTVTHTYTRTGTSHNTTIELSDYRNCESFSDIVGFSVSSSSVHIAGQAFNKCRTYIESCCKTKCNSNTSQCYTDCISNP